MHEHDPASMQLAANQTADLVGRTVEAGAHILDIGCGTGRVAKELVNRGFRVTGIDTNDERVEETRKQGIEAHVSAWPGFEISPVDAVLFGASLHHMADTESAIRAAASVLEGAGVVIADEFAYEAMDAHTAEWLTDRVCEGVASGFVHAGADPLLDALLSGRDPLPTWMEDHHEHVTPSAEMILAAESSFRSVKVSASPYLYRYLVAASTPDEHTSEWIATLLQKEEDAIAAGTIAAIGCRMILTEPSL